MTRTTLIGLLTLILLICCGCENSGTMPNDDDDDDTTSVIDLEGTVVDPYLGGAGVGDAWILVDTGTEQFSARTAADGTFLVPDVPDTTPIVLTVAGEDRQAVTWSGLVLADTELPFELSCTYRATSYYDFPTMRVTVEVTDAPVGSWVFVTGDGLYDYPYAQVMDEAAVELDFEVTLYDPELTTYTISALVQDGTTGELVGAGATTVDVADEVTAAIDADDASPAELDVTVNQPLLAGEPLTDLDTDYMSSLGLVYLDDGALAGWTRHWSHGEGGFDLLVDHVPVEGHVHHLGLYLAEDLSTADEFAYAQVPFAPGTTDLAVEVLDSPAPDGDEFTPGTTLTWAPVDGAETYGLYVADEVGVAWWISTPDPELSFPALPEGFDSTIIMESGTWALRAQYHDAVEGENGTETTYKVSETAGGDASF